MAVTAYKTPGTCANAIRDEFGTDWVNWDNAKTSNDAWATCVMPKISNSQWLRATNFGFTTSDIPSGSTIDGIEVKIERHASVTDYVKDIDLYLRKTSGQVGDNKASATIWTTGDTSPVYGGAADTWNAGLVDTDIVGNTNFGLDFAAWNTHASEARTASVDCISIRVHYTAAEDHRRGSFFKML